MYKIILFLLLSITSYAQTVIRKGVALGTNDYTVSFNPPITAFNSNTVYTITFANSNTTTVVMLDPTGVVEATSIRDNAGNMLSIGALKAGGTYNMIYDGINLRAIDVTTSINTNVTWLPKTASYTPLVSDGEVSNPAFLLQSAGDISLTIPSYTSVDYPDGQQFTIRNDGTGTASILRGSGVVFNSIDPGPWTLEQNEYAVATKIDSINWELRMFKRIDFSGQTQVAVFTEYSTVGNVTTGEDILFTDTIAASTFSADGNVIKGRFSGIIALNGNDKTVRLKFGGTTIATRLAFDSPTLGQGWTLDYEIIRTSATTQKTNATFNFDGITSSYYAAASEDMATDIVIQLTGESTSTDDIIKHTASGNFAPGAGSGTIPPPIEPPVVPFFAADNAVKGGDGYEHTYTGTWAENLSLPGWYANTETYSGTTNDSVTMRFNGTSIEWYNETASHLGIAGVSIDGGAETNVDLYAATSTQQVKVYTSPTLTQAEHKIKVRVTGTKNASSSGPYITHDYFKVFNNQDVTVEPPDPTDPANLFVTTTGTNSGDCSPSPCLTVAYALTQAVSGDLIQIGPGTFTETSYLSVPLGVKIRGSGIDVTVIKGSSGLWDDFDDFDYEFDKSLFQYVSGSEQNGNQYIKDLTIDGTGTAYNDGTGPTHSALLNDRGMYGGIYVRYRNNVTMDGIKIRKCFFDAVFLSNTKFAKIQNSQFIDNAYGQTQFATGALMWGHNYNDDMEISGNTINEGFGNGMKAFAALSGGCDQGIVNRFKVHGNNISVTPTGQWNGGGAPNIAFENWGVPMRDCELYDNYLDANISLVDNCQDDNGLATIRVYNNTMDMLTRSGGINYCIELSVSYAEIDHNYMIGGRDATIVNYQAAAYPTLTSFYEFWEIHHNVVLAPQGGNPSMFIRGNIEGLHNVNAYNNTIDIYDYPGDGNTGHKNFCFFGSVAAAGGAPSNTNINAKNNVVWDKSGGASTPFANRMWYIGTGSTFSSVTISNNDLYAISQTAATGITYSSNITTAPQVNATGVKPTPYYIPINGGNLNNAGVDVGYPYLGAAPDMGAYEFD